MIRESLVLSSLLFSSASIGEVLNVQYSSFYSHVKKIAKEDTDKLRFAFGFTHVIDKRLCHIKKANIVTQKQVMPLKVENGTRFTVPSDKVLKMAKANVSIELDDNANQCDMSVQLETKMTELKQTYSHAELTSLLEQYRAFFSNMGSFMSFMMPSAEGLVFKFEPSVTLPAKFDALKDSSGNITLDQAWLDNNLGIELPAKPIRITALVVK
ncbi:DUF2987 domain-containing protein [Paraglaciecola sp.]|uniref:DUF2987 domain-containing protein n=1 Tax=Paraglaciecola sp. TaxID=1920173 RepID=UPI003EFA0D67